MGPLMSALGGDPHAQNFRQGTGLNQTTNTKQSPVLKQRCCCIQYTSCQIIERHVYYTVSYPAVKILILTVGSDPSKSLNCSIVNISPAHDLRNRANQRRTSPRKH